MPRDYRTIRPSWPRTLTDSIPQQDPDAHPCPGRCNAAYRAAEARSVQHSIAHDLDPRPGNPLWCMPCVTALRGDLTDWPDLAARLQDEIGAGIRAQTGEVVSGSKIRPIHEHERPSLLLDEVVRWLPACASAVARALELRARASVLRGLRPVAAVADACGFLLTHLDWRLNDCPSEHHQDARAFGTQLARFTLQARTLTGALDPQPVRINGIPCPMCDYKALEYEIEDRSARRAAVTRYVYDSGGNIRVTRRPARAEEVTELRLRPPTDKRGRPAANWEPTVPQRSTETGSAAMLGAATGYIRCRRCTPAFRMTVDEYTRWTRMLEHDARARGLDVEVKLARVLGSRALGSCAGAELPRIQEGRAA